MGCPHTWTPSPWRPQTTLKSLLPSKIRPIAVATVFRCVFSPLILLLMSLSKLSSDVFKCCKWLTVCLPNRAPCPLGLVQPAPRVWAAPAAGAAGAQLPPVHGGAEQPEQPEHGRCVAKIALRQRKHSQMWLWNTPQTRTAACQDTILMAENVCVCVCGGGTHTWCSDAFVEENVNGFTLFHLWGLCWRHFSVFLLVSFPHSNVINVKGLYRDDVRHTSLTLTLPLIGCFTSHLKLWDIICPVCAF